MISLCQTLFFFTALVLHASTAAQYRPVVLMHGLMGNAASMADPKKWIENDFPGIYVKNVEIGDGRLDSLFMPINEQVQSLASQIQADPKLKNGFNLIGHSQGGLLSRAYIERYNTPPVYNFISWEGPHQGVYGVPGVNALCPDVECPWLDEFMDSLLKGSWTDPEVQKHWSFATYWKDPFNYDLYLKTNTFLADINNERPQKNETYKKNMISLNKMLLIYSTSDDIVIPKESPWWNFYAENSDTKIVPWTQSQTYLEDWIGLQTLANRSAIDMQHVPCGHIDTSRAPCESWYDKYTRPFLNNTL